MTYVKKPKSTISAAKTSEVLPKVLPVAVPLDPIQQRRQQAPHAIQRLTARPQVAMKQAIKPAFSALQLHREEQERVEGARPALAVQVSELSRSLLASAVQDALQRQREQAAPLPVVRQPQSQADWVTVMRQQYAEDLGDDPNPTGRR